MGYAWRKSASLIGIINNKGVKMKLYKCIEGLEYCVAPARKGWPHKPNIAEAGCEQYDCPYSNNCEDILFDALELLKEQQSVYERGKRDGISQYLRDRKEDEEYEY